MNFMPRYPSASGPDAAGSAWALSLSSAWAAVCTETPSRRLEGPSGDDLVPQGQAAGYGDGVSGVQADGHVGAHRFAVLDHIHIGDAAFKKHSVAGDEHCPGDLVGGGSQLHRQPSGRSWAPSIIAFTLNWPTWASTTPPISVTAPS